MAPMRRMTIKKTLMKMMMSQRKVQIDYTIRPNLRHNKFPVCNPISKTVKILIYIRLPKTLTIRILQSSK